MNFYVLMFSFLLMGTLTGYLAQRRGRDPVIWFFIGVLFGIFGLMALFFMPTLEEVKVEENAPMELPKQEESSEELNKEWFFLDQEHKQQGPMSFVFLKTKWADSDIDSATYVWSEGMAEWMRIRDLPHFLERISS